MHIHSLRDQVFATIVCRFTLRDHLERVTFDVRSKPFLVFFECCVLLAAGSILDQLLNAQFGCFIVSGISVAYGALFVID